MWVVLYHFGEGGQLAALQSTIPRWLNTVVFTSGHFGVPIFFVLSGFVIAHSIGDDHVGLRYFGRFALRRSIRLDFPYWASIVVTLGFVAIKARMVAGSTPVSVSAGQLLGHMFYLQDFLQLPQINSVYWTLCFEIQFYLMFCALLGVAQRFQKSSADRRPQAVVFVIAALVSLIWPLFPALHLRGLALPNWHGFLLGAFVCWSLKKVMPARWFATYAVLVFGVWSITRDSFTLACVISASLVFAVGRAGYLGTWLSAQWLQFLGKVSYSIYLLHVPVSGAAFFLASRVLGPTPVEQGLAMLLVIAVNCAAAQLFWWAVERPSTALGRKIRKM
jgi:peptidoglycan/LPS O-acetylase OafA/YrhL